MSFQQFLLVLRGRWRLVLGVFMPVFLLAVAVGLILPVRYTATASVLVDVTPDPIVVGGTAAPMAESMQTQVDIASSERVAQRVVETLRLDEQPEFRQKWQRATAGRGDFTAWLAATLRKRISIPSTVESDVLTISAKWSDPKFAATLANAFAQAYIDTTVELKMRSTKQYAKLFDESARKLRADLEAKQLLLSDYENSHSLVMTDERLDIENTRLNELSSQLVSIQGQLQDSQSRQHSVAGGDDSRPEILQSPLIASLKTDLSRAEARQHDLAIQLGTSHPDYQRNQAEISSLKERIGREESQVVSSLSATMQVNQRRERDITAALAAQKQRVLELKHQRDEAAMLQSDVLAAQRNLDSVAQRLAQSNLQAQTPQATIALLTPASEPSQRSSPSYLMSLFIALVFGALVGVATALLRERRDRRIRSDAELVELLGLPILGKLASVEKDTRLLGPLSAPFNPGKALTR